MSNEEKNARRRISLFEKRTPRVASSSKHANQSGEEKPSFPDGKTQDANLEATQKTETLIPNVEISKPTEEVAALNTVESYFRQLQGPDKKIFDNQAREVIARDFGFEEMAQQIKGLILLCKKRPSSNRMPSLLDKTVLSNLSFTTPFSGSVILREVLKLKYWELPREIPQYSERPLRDFLQKLLEILWTWNIPEHPSNLIRIPLDAILARKPIVVLEKGRLEPYLEQILSQKFDVMFSTKKDYLQTLSQNESIPDPIETDDKSVSVISDHKKGSFSIHFTMNEKVFLYWTSASSWSMSGADYNSLSLTDRQHVMTGGTTYSNGSGLTEVVVPHSIDISVTNEGSILITQKKRVYDKKEVYSENGDWAGSESVPNDKIETISQFDDVTSGDKQLTKEKIHKSVAEWLHSLGLRIPPPEIIEN